MGYKYLRTFPLRNRLHSHIALKQSATATYRVLLGSVTGHPNRNYLQAMQHLRLGEMDSQEQVTFFLSILNTPLIG